MREADPNHPCSDMFFIVFNNQLYYFKKAKDFPVRVNEEAVFICYFRSNVTCNLHIFSMQVSNTKCKCTPVYVIFNLGGSKVFAIALKLGLSILSYFQFFSRFGAG